MKVLITVKAYPAISSTYGETVCTAGINEEGKWIRIYPIPFRYMDYENQYKKYHWVELDLIRNTKDFRPETHRSQHLESITTVGEIPSDGDAWTERRKAILEKVRVYTNLDELIAEAKNKDVCTSLAVFKPTRIKDFIYRRVSDTWDTTKLQTFTSMQQQGNLFDGKDENDIEQFEVVDKLPYKFSFVFEDDSGRESTLMIEDWETGMLYWKCLKRHEGNEALACADVRKKYYDNFALTKDYYFFLGTTKANHYRAPNPFVIIGDFRPKFITQEQMQF